MHKKIILIIFCILVSTICQAETCPSIPEIQANFFHGWEAYSNEEGTPLSEDDLKEFRQTIGYFHSIRWLDLAPEGDSHCYYLDKDHAYSIGFLAKHNLIPDYSTPGWHQEHGEPRCEIGIEQCKFMETTQLIPSKI